MDDEDTIALEYVSFKGDVKGPRGRSCNTISSAETDSLVLYGDMVVWVKNGKRRMAHVSNTRDMEVADET